MSRAALSHVFALALFSTLWVPVRVEAQSTGFEQRPAGWTTELSLGARIPTTLYDEFIIRRQGQDSIVKTRWEEISGPGWDTRLGVRYNPEGGVGFFVGGFVGGAKTTASFLGGIVPPEKIARSVRYSGFDFGVTMRLKSWSQGRGILDYHVGGVVQRSLIDLKPGHRDALTYFQDIKPVDLDWDTRTNTSWGLNLGVSVRAPVGDRWAIRTTFKDMIVPANTTSLAEQEKRDINTFSGERVSVSLNQFTSHNLALEVGVEYTLSWGRPRRDVVRRVPEDTNNAEVDPAVTNAMRLVAEGDTASAVAALEHRTSVEPRDGYAWRELALLKANRGEIDPTARPEALATLERALNMNPGDTELLRAYGRLRGLTERAGSTPEAVAVSPVELSSLSVISESDGSIRVAWATRGLSAGTDGRYRFEAAVEVFTADGSRAPIRPGLAPLHEGEDDQLLLLDSAEGLPVSLSVDFFLADPTPGFYTVRIRMTDLETGARQVQTQGLEIP